MKPLLLFPTLFAMTLTSTFHAAHAARPLVFVSAFASGVDGAIHAFELDESTGALRALARTTDADNPFFLALSPNGQHLYSIHTESFGGKDNQIASYALVDRTGKLKLLNRQTTRGRASCYIDVDATGRTALVANYSTGDVVSLPIRRDGSLGAAASHIKHSGSSVNPQRQTAPFAHCFVVSPDNRFAFAADLGIDKVMSYRLDADRATLQPHEPAFARLAPGSGPRHLTFHPKRGLVYVINELSNTITAFRYAAQTGTLTALQTISTIPADYRETTHTADVKITPDGNFLYGTNRGHDSIAAYRIADDGSLSLIEIAPSLGKGPQNLAISPSGQFLLCANMPGNGVVVFKIDSASGRLTAVGEVTQMPKPSCIMILE